MARSIRKSDDLGSEFMGLAVDAGTVISRRLSHMATGRLSTVEALLMVTEKQQAFCDAATRAGLGAMRGEFLHQIWGHMLAPYRSAAQANAQRLSGPVRDRAKRRR